MSIGSQEQKECTPCNTKEWEKQRKKELGEIKGALTYLGKRNVYDREVFPVIGSLLAKFFQLGGELK